MKITGRILKKNHVAKCPTCRGTGSLVTIGFDYDQYWILDYEGQEDRTEGTFLYDRVAFPTLRDAQRRHQEDRDAARHRFDTSKTGQYLKRQRDRRASD